MSISRLLSLPAGRILLPIALALSVAACAPNPVPPQSGPATPAHATPAAAETPAAIALTGTPAVAQPGIAAAVTSLNGFSMKLYGEVARDREGNLAVSPLGSFILLEMLYEGSAGAAHEEMAKSLGFSPDSLAEVGALVNELDALPSLALAQKIYLDKKAKLVEAYLQRVGPMLAEPVQVLPFANDPVGAVGIINDWVALRTKGVIKNFLPPLPPLTVSVLVSVLHFQGKWAYQFPKTATVPADFTSAGAAPYRVFMMSVQVPGLTLFTVPKGRGVILPYSDDTEMLFLLPDAGAAPDDLWAGLDPKVGLGATVAKDGKPVIVDLPRLRFEVPTFKLTEAWRAVGLETTISEPDLSPMLVLDPPSSVELEVYHKTYIKVDEEGTEAAAATAVVIQRKSASPDEPIPERIRFDRPFGFLLRHSKTGAILMLGRVEHPEEADIHEQ